MPAPYWAATRAPRYSLLFALPLLVLYEVLARLLSGEQGIRNGADVLLKSLFILLGGGHGLTVFAVIVLGTGLVFVVRDWRKSGAPARMLDWQARSGRRRMSFWPPTCALERVRRKRLGKSRWRFFSNMPPRSAT